VWRCGAAAGQVEHEKDVGVAQLVGQVEGQHVAGGQGGVGLQGAQGRACPAQDPGGLLGGGVDPLGGHIRPAVDGLVEDGLAEVGHADLVEVREGQGHPGRGLGPAHRAPFAAGEVAGLGDQDRMSRMKILRRRDDACAGTGEDRRVDVAIAAVRAVISARRRRFPDAPRHAGEAGRAGSAPAIIS
jgi:hypothetical protein